MVFGSYCCCLSCRGYILFRLACLGLAVIVVVCVVVAAAAVLLLPRCWTQLIGAIFLGTY